MGGAAAPETAVSPTTRDHEFDYERVTIADLVTECNYLNRGYRNVTGGLPPGFERRRPLYRVVAFLEKPATFDRWAPAAPEPADELAARIREELDRRIAAAESTR